MEDFILNLKILECKIKMNLYGTIEYFCNYMINLMARWMNFLDRYRKDN